MKRISLLSALFFLLPGLARAQVVEPAPESAPAPAAAAPAPAEPLPADTVPPVSLAPSAAGRAGWTLLSVGWLMPPLNDKRAVYGLDFGLLAATHDEVVGLQVGGLGACAHTSLAGFQVSGFGNAVGEGCGGALYGVSASAGLMKFGHLYGLACAGLAVQAEGDSAGLQLAGLGCQSAGRMNGLQVSALVNATERADFLVQLAGLCNFAAHDLNGVQIAALGNSVGGRLNGLQIGLVNQAACGTYLQLGLINFSQPGRGAEGLSFFPLIRVSF